MLDSDSEQIEVDTKLFNTIRKKNISTGEKLKKIKRLLSKSPKPNVNARDGNYEENTPLHMAVSRNEIEVVDLLIAEGADTNSMNKNGLTPLLLAKRRQCTQDIITVLQNNSTKDISEESDNAEQLVADHAIQRITKRYISDFDCSDRSQWSSIESIKIGKILKISCSTIQEGLTFIQDELFVKIFNESAHLFLIIVKIKNEVVLKPTGGIIDILKRLENLLDKRKPMIIQLESLNFTECLIMFKEPHKSFEFLEDDWGDSLSEEELIHELTPGDTLRLPLLLKALHFEFVGVFKGNLLETTFDVKCELDGWRLIDYAARSDDALSLRFLLLVKWDIRRQNEDGRRVLEIAAQYATPPSLSALLDMSTTYDPEELLPSCWQRERLALKNFDGYTPLLITVLYGKIETLKFLINCGIREDHAIAINLAWSNQCYDKVLLFLMAEAPFPDGFKLDGLKGTESIEALRKFTKHREDFHKAIEENAHDKVKCFVRDYPRSKKAYNFNNQSALVTALKAAQYDMGAVLQINGFSIGENEKWMLSDEQKWELKQAKSKYFRKQDNSHIIFLLSKSKVAHKGDYFSRIRELYEHLDDIPHVSTVLKVLEQSSIREIIFDFNKDSVDEIDPTKTGSGTADHVAGSLCVAAKRPLETLLGTLAHELTHFAMQTVYNNESNPYTISDEQTKADFKRIVDCYQTKGKIHDIIDRVFKNYKDPNDWPSELIVRVNHLRAHYKKDEARLSNITEKAKELFNFYDSRIHKELSYFLEKPVYYKNQHLNDLLQQLDKIGRSNIQIQDNCLFTDDIINSETSLVFSSSLPQLIKVALYQSLRIRESVSSIKGNYVFTAASHFRSQDMVLKIRNSFKSDSNQTLVVDCTCDYDSGREVLWATIESFSQQHRVIFISDTSVVKNILNEKKKGLDIRLIEREYRWIDLHVEFQKSLLEQTVDFQGYTTALSQLISADSYRAKFLPLVDLLEGNRLTIGKPLPISYGYDESWYIERTVNDNTTKSILSYPPKKISELLQRIQREKVLLLVDRAGMGKSTLLTHFSRQIKQQDSGLWVTRLDLNDYTDVFAKVKKRQSDSFEAIEFLSEELLKLSSTIEKAIFVELLENRRIVLMFDGFDEISSRYKSTALAFMVGLKESSIYQLWITTRSNVGNDLIDELKPIICTLQPFTVEDQIEFLTKFWRKSMDAIWYDAKIKVFAISLVKKLSTSIKDTKTQLASIPLQARMLAEFFYQDLDNFCQSSRRKPFLPAKLDLSEVYKRFVRRKYHVYISEKNNPSKGNLAREAIANILTEGVNLRKVHQQLALGVIFPYYKDDLLKFSKKHTLQPEELNRIGIVRYALEKPAFIHRSFAEYYVADFFINQLSKRGASLTVRNFFLDTILNGLKCEDIRSFINSLLISPELEISNEILIWYGREIDTLWWRGFRSNLYYIVREGNANIVDFILNGLIAANCLNTLKNIFEVGKRSREVFVTAAESGCVDLLNILWTKYKGICGNNTKELKQLLLSANFSNVTAWYIAVDRNDIDIFDTLLTYAKETLLEADDFIDVLLKEGVWYRAAECGQIWVNMKLLTFAKEMNYTPESFRQLLLAESPYRRVTVWSCAAYGGNVLAFHILWMWFAEASLAIRHIQRILCAKDNIGNTIWHIASICNLPGEKIVSNPMRYIIMNVAPKRDRPVIFTKMWHFAKEVNLNVYKLRNALLQENDFGETVWHIAIGYRNDILANQLLTVIKEEDKINTKAFFNELLRGKYRAGNLWWNAVKASNVVLLECVWKWICEAELEPKEIETIITERDERRTTWQLIAGSFNAEMLNNLWRYAKQSNLTSEGLSCILLEIDNRGLNVWQLAIESKYLITFNKFEEFLELLLCRQFAYTTSDIAVKCGSYETLNDSIQLIVIYHCEELIEYEDIRSYVHIHQNSATSKRIDTFDSLVKWTRKAQISQERIKELLAIRNKRHEAAIICAIKEKHFKVALDLLQLGADVKDLNERQWNYLLVCMTRGNIDYTNLVPIIEARLITLSEQVMHVPKIETKYCFHQNTALIELFDEIYCMDCDNAVDGVTNGTSGPRSVIAEGSLLDYLFYKHRVIQRRFRSSVECEVNENREKI